MEIQAVTVTGNWLDTLDTFIESVTIYSVEGGPWSDVMGYHHHHHHVTLVARISLTLSRHSSLSFIALGRSSGQHPVSSHSCWIYVRAGRPAFARPCVGVHKSTSLMSSSLLLRLSFLISVKKGPKHLTKWTAMVFIPSMRFLLQCLVSGSFLVLLFFFFFFSHQHYQKVFRKSEWEQVYSGCQDFPYYPYRF